MDERRDRLDEVLDSALAGYGVAPENEGLERRILARVAEAATRRHPKRRLMLALGAATAAMAACLFLRTTTKTAEHSVPANTGTRALTQIEAPGTRTIRRPEPAPVLARASKPRMIRKKPAEPKLSQFPSPSPLTGEEQALVQLVTHNAKDTAQELTYLGGPVKPIQITQIDIRPIRSE
jgi:hypothetical protein